MITVARRSDGAPAAILPLYVCHRRPLRLLRFIGHGPGDWLGPIYDPVDAAIASSEMRELLGKSSGWDLFLAEHVPSTERSTLGIDGTVLRREGFPILPFRGRSWDQLLADRSSNFRQQVRRRERQLARAHTLTFRLCDDPHRLDADIDLLFQLHAARWTNADSSAFDGARRDFHREFAHIALARGWLRLWVMELDSTPVAVWYGFRYAGVEWYYQAGRDPAYDSASVGFVLLCHTVRAALQDGANAYWFLRGGEAYKDRFAEDRPVLETVAAGRTLRGRAAVAAVRAADRAPAAARRRLRSQFG